MVNVNNLFKMANQAAENHNYKNYKNYQKKTSNNNKPNVNRGWDEGFFQMNVGAANRAQIVQNAKNPVESFEDFLRERSRDAMDQFGMGFELHIPTMLRMYHEILKHQERVQSRAIAAAAMLGLIRSPTDITRESVIFQIDPKEVQRVRIFVKEKLEPTFPEYQKQYRSTTLAMIEDIFDTSRSKLTRAQMRKISSYMGEILHWYSLAEKEKWFKKITGVPKLRAQIFYACVAPMILEGIKNKNDKLVFDSKKAMLELLPLNTADRKKAAMILGIFDQKEILLSNT